MAKTKLPKDIKKKVEEWKFMSGALMLCLVAYYDGEDVQTLQFVHILHLILYLMICPSPDSQCREYSCSRECLHCFLQ